MDALQQHNSHLSSDRDSRRSSTQRHKVGQGGTPATKLPRLFAAIKPEKKTKAKGTDESSTVFSSSESTWNKPSKERSQKLSNGKNKEDYASVGPDEILYEDDALERAREEQARTIAELKSRKNSVATRDDDAMDRARLQRKRGASHDFWHGIDDLDDGDEPGPSSSRHS